MPNPPTSRTDRRRVVLAVLLAWGVGLAVQVRASEPETNAPVIPVPPTNAPGTSAPAMPPPPSPATASNAPVSAGPPVSLPVPKVPPPPAPPSDPRAARSRAPAKAASKNDLSEFRIIAERNIFNQNRRRRAAQTAVTEKPKPVKVDSFALLGTMSYAKGTYAFFNGTDPEFRKSLKLGDTVAGYQVKDIGQNLVKLAADGQELELRLGMQLRRQDHGPWQLSERTDSYAGTDAGGANGSSTGGTGSASSGGESDLLKRLMQQRAQELKQ